MLHFMKRCFCFLYIRFRLSLIYPRNCFHASLPKTRFKSFSCSKVISKIRGGSRTAATSKMEGFVIIVNGFQPLTIITKRFILDVAAVLDPSLRIVSYIFDINKTETKVFYVPFKLTVI